MEVTSTLAFQPPSAFVPRPTILTITAVAAATIYLLVHLIFLRRAHSPFTHLPTLPARNLAEQRSSMRTAYEKYLKHDNPCLLRHPSHTLLLLPLSTINADIKSLPYADADWREEIGDRFVSRWTRIVPRPELLAALHRDLNGVVARLMPTLVGECMRELPVALLGADGGNGDEWVTVRLQEVGMRILARFVGLMAAGEVLARDERWVRLTSTHIYHCGIAAFALQGWPWYLRDLVAPVNPAVRRLARDQQEMREIIEPILRERQKQQQQQRAGKPAKRPVDMLEAILGHHAAGQAAASSNPKPLDIDLVAEDMLSLGILASNTTASLLTDVLVQLVAHPEDQPALRAEVEETLDGRPFTALTQADLAGLPKLDSFIKESQRLSPVMSLGMARCIKRRGGITLSNSNGTNTSITHLPQGTFIGTAIDGVLRDENVFPDAARFDGLRHFKLRFPDSAPGQQRSHQQKPPAATPQENRHQLVSLGEHDTQWGVGVQACLGRWLASYEIKMVVAWILLFCDLEVERESKESRSAIGNKSDAKVRVKRKRG